MGRNNSRGAKVAAAVQEVKLVRQVNHELMKGEIELRLGKCGSLEQADFSGDDSEVSDDEPEAPCNKDQEVVMESTDMDTDNDKDEETVQERERELPFNEEQEDGMESTDTDTDDDEDEEIVQKRIIDKWRLRTRVAVSKMRLMRRKVTRQSREISQRHPDIGQVMEKFAEACDVGADKWRRTGMLTFGGEKKKEKRLTYRKLQEHLEAHYNEKISLGTVVELCAKRHKRRRTSNRYKGVANIRYRRAWKGYNLKLNPDSHWSRAMYRQLDSLVQKADNSVQFARDDQSGFRLDTTFTHKQHGSLGTSNTITTHTDFVNKNATVLQISSYNFPESPHYPETCVGVVKGSMVHSKSPSQHMADMIMLERKDELAMLFADCDNEFVRVDGATDEGPSHLEVQFLWTERHLTKRRKLTVVTSRCSGDSYLNRVELQNGHLARGHSNLFIPSTLNGAPVDDNGDFDYEKFKENIRSAIEQYITRVDGTPAMKTNIKLYNGVEDSPLLRRRPYLLTYLKGSKKSRNELKLSLPTLFEYFESISKLQGDHMVVSELPLKYAFILKCCGKDGCIHPLCNSAHISINWSSGGPSVDDVLPIPVIDEMDETCDRCDGKCVGHYKRTLTHVGTDKLAPVPSVRLAKELAADDTFSQSRIAAIAKDCLLSPQTVEVYINHLKNVHANRMKGVEKARKTRANKN